MVELRGLLQGANAEDARGTRALSARDFATAVNHFRAAVELAPDNPTLRHKFGTALSLVGDTKGALQQFREAVRLSPAFAQRITAWVCCSTRSGSRGRRLSTCPLLSAMGRTTSTRGCSWQTRLHGTDSSTARWRSIARHSSRQFTVRICGFGIGLVFARLGRYNEAREVLTEGARLHPEQSRFAEMVARVDAARR